MGGSKGGGGGQLPDYSQMIEDMAYWNRSDLTSPTGGLRWNEDRSAATEYYSPEAQSQLDLRNALQQHAMGQMLGGFLGVTPQSFAGGMSNQDLYGGYLGPNNPAMGLKDWESGGASPWWDGYGFSAESQGQGQNRRYEPLGPGDPMDAGDGGGGDDPAMRGGGGFDPWGGGDTGGGGTPDMGPAIDATQFLSGPFEGFGYGDQDFLQGLIGADGGANPYGGGGVLGGWNAAAGGGGGGGSYGMNWGGGSADFSDLTDLITYDEEGNPNIGPGLAFDLDLGSLPGLASEGDLMGARDRAEQAMFDRSMMLLEPGQQQRLAAEQEMLANRGVTEGSEISQLYGANRDLAFNQQRQMAALDAVGEGRREYGFLSDEARQDRTMTLTERLQQAGLQNQAQQSMTNANLAGRGQEAQEAYWQGQLGLQGAANANAARSAANQYNLGMQGLDLQRMGMAQGWEQQQLANQLASQAQLWQQQMSERGTGFGELASMLGLGGTGQGMNYSLGGPIDVLGAAGQAGQNQMLNWQQNPLNMLMQLGGSLGAAALG